MNLKLYTAVIFFAVFIFSGCKSASKLYEKGDYDGAVELAVKKLQKKPHDEELKSIMREAYRYAVNEREQNIRNLSSRPDELRYEWMYNEYAALQKMHDAIRRSPEAMQVVTPVDYSSYLATYGIKAGEVHYNRAEEWMNRSSDRNNIKNAYREYQAAFRFTPTADIRAKMDDAFDAAVVNVVIMPMDRYNRNGGGYIFSSYSSNNLQEQISRSLVNHTGNEFVRFYDQWNARSSNIRPDHFVDMSFSRFNMGRAYDQVSRREVSKQVVVREIVYRPDSVVKVYETVKATITTTKRTMISEGNLLVDISDNDGRRIWSDVFRGEHRWDTEFSNFTGDARALGDADKALIDRRPAQQPREEEVIRCIADQLDDDVVWRIRNFYSRF